MKQHIFAPYIMEHAVNDLRVYDIMRITHLNIAFGLIHDNVVTVDHLQYLDRIAVYKRINPALRVILSIGGWGADGFSQAAMTKEGRSTFVSSAMDIVRQYDFDGVDIDWEYPCIDTAEIACDPADKVNFTDLMQDLRNGLTALGKETGKSYLLTCAVGGDAYFIENTEMDKVAQIVDYVNLMTYDLRGGFEEYAGHHTNLYPQSGDPDGPCGERTVRIYHEAGVPYEKMVLGAAFYGRRWAGVVDGGTHGLGQKASTVGNIRTEFDLQDEKAVAANRFTKLWDDNAKAAYLYDGADFISYETPESISAKCDFIREKGLAGLMYWAYGNHTLFEAVDNYLD